MVEVRTESNAPAYLVLADAFDPGWSATVDGSDGSHSPRVCGVPRRLPPRRNPHRSCFGYQPAGFKLGLAITCLSLIVAFTLLIWRRPLRLTLAPEHQELNWPSYWPFAGMAVLLLILLLSAVEFDKSNAPVIHPRWACGASTASRGGGSWSHQSTAAERGPQRFGAPQPRSIFQVLAIRHLQP